MSKFQAYKEELERKLKKANDLYEAAEVLGDFYEKIYYSPIKLDVICKVIDEHDLPIVVRRKAVSTHTRAWFGWRKSVDPPGRQYCVKGHSGYVTAFIIPDNGGKKQCVGTP